jgi:hypothetical protein
LFGFLGWTGLCLLIGTEASAFLQICAGAETGIDLAGDNQGSSRPACIHACSAAEALGRRHLIAMAIILGRYSIDVGTEFMEELS